jgi:hypothetical protein
MPYANLAHVYTLLLRTQGTTPPTDLAAANRIESSGAVLSARMSALAAAVGTAVVSAFMLL